MRKHSLLVRALSNSRRFASRKSSAPVKMTTSSPDKPAPLDKDISPAKSSRIMKTISSAKQKLSRSKLSQFSNSTNVSPPSFIELWATVLFFLQNAVLYLRSNCAVSKLAVMISFVNMSNTVYSQRISGANMAILQKKTSSKWFLLSIGNCIIVDSPIETL